MFTKTLGSQGEKIMASIAYKWYQDGKNEGIGIGREEGIKIGEAKGIKIGETKGIKIGETKGEKKRL